MKTLKPVEESHEEYERIERKIIELFRKQIYIPLLKEFFSPAKTLKNARPGLLEAIRSGRISFSRGTFSGQFTSQISKEIKNLGARWSRSEKAWKIPASELPIEVRNEISASFTKFQDMVSKIDAKLSAVLPEELASQLKIEKLFDSVIYKTDRSLHKTLSAITVSPELTPAQRKQIAEQWQNNMDLWIKDFTEKEIKKLRSDIQKSVMHGNRFESAISSIKKSYGVTERKAKFLARQETKLLTTKLKEVRYVYAGVTKYKWRSVTGTPLHPVRPMHKALNERSNKGEIFDFRNPPVDDPNGSRHNPGANYNCFPGSTLITLDRPINSIFRRSFSGELSLLVCDDGTILESTRNHPILTQRGWIASQSIQIGDYIFNDVRKHALTDEVYSKYMETQFEYLFNALGTCLQVRKDVSSPSDFHGDVSESENINIISINRELMFDRIFEFFEMLQQLNLNHANSSALNSRSFDHSLLTWGLSTDGIMSFLSELKSFLQTHIRHSDFIRLGATSSNYLSEIKPSSDNVSTNLIFQGNRKFTHPILVILNRVFITLNDVMGNKPANSLDFYSSQAEVLAEDIRINSKFFGDLSKWEFSSFINPRRIVDKIFRNFSGHIYNLETKNNWFFANNAMSHNCRCVAIPVVDFK